MVCGLRLWVDLHFGGSRRGLAKNNLYWFVGMVVLIEEFVFLLVEVVFFGWKLGFAMGLRKEILISLWVWWVLIEEFVFLMEEVVCLWMEGGLCRGIKEGSLGEKSLSGFRKVLFCFFFFNIVLTWKIMGALEVSVI